MAIRTNQLSIAASCCCVHAPLVLLMLASAWYASWLPVNAQRSQYVTTTALCIVHFAALRRKGKGDDVAEHQMDAVVRAHNGEELGLTAGLLTELSQQAGCKGLGCVLASACLKRHRFVHGQRPRLQLSPEDCQLLMLGCVPDSARHLLAAPAESMPSPSPTSC